jgi:hypothetical protein
MSPLSVIYRKMHCRAVGGLMKRTPLNNGKLFILEKAIFSKGNNCTFICLMLITLPFFT